MDIKNQRKSALIEILTVWINRKNIRCKDKFYKIRDKLIRDKYLSDSNITLLSKFLAIEVGKDVSSIINSLETFKEPDSIEYGTLDLTLLYN